METNLAATVRTDSGKGAARKIRAAGSVPGVMYGKGSEGTPVAIDPTVFDTIFRNTRNRNTIIELDVEGQNVPCLVRSVQRHPLTRELLHVDFYKLEAGQEVEVMVPLQPEGRPAGAVLGGRLRLIRREVAVQCDFRKIPETLPVDVSPLEIGDMIRISQVQTPEGVSLVYDNDFNVVTVYGKRGGAAARATKRG